MTKHNTAINSIINNNQEIKLFFNEVTNSSDIQTKLYKTKEIIDVVTIAADCGYTILATEIMQLQALKFLSVSDVDLEIIAAGNKPTSCCQWGRGGNGYLNRPGFWFLQLYQWLLTANKIHLIANNTELTQLITAINNQHELKNIINSSCNLNEVIAALTKYHLELSLVSLRDYLGNMILIISNSQRELIASGNLNFTT